MIVATMLGLASPVLPDGRVSIHNCPDDDDYKEPVVKHKPVKKVRTPKPPAGPKCCQIRHESALKRYGEAFAKFGGVATKTELASVIPNMTMETIHQYLIRHQGDTTKIIGKRGREYVWEWIHGND